MILTRLLLLLFFFFLFPSALLLSAAPSAAVAAAEAGAAAFGPVFGAADPAVVAGAVAPVAVFGPVPPAAGSPPADPHDSHSDSYYPDGYPFRLAGHSGCPVYCPGGRSLCWAGRLDSACWVEHSCYRCLAAAGLRVRQTAVGCFGCRADRSGYPAEHPG